MKSPIRQSKVDENPTLTAPDYFRLGEVERVSALRPSSLKTGGQSPLRLGSGYDGSARVRFPAGRGQFLLSGRSPGERLDKRNSRE